MLVSVWGPQEAAAGPVGDPTCLILDCSDLCSCTPAEPVKLLEGALLERPSCGPAFLPHFNLFLKNRFAQIQFI